MLSEMVQNNADHSLFGSIVKHSRRTRRDLLKSSRIVGDDVNVVNLVAVFGIDVVLM
jgi:hypothetical protein